jgi:hypothetical protein
VSIIHRLTPPFETIAEAWTGQYRVKGSIADADCVIGLSFGYRGKHRQIKPGLSNEDIAAAALAHYPHLPKIFQFEIADAYAALGARDARSVMRITKHRTAGKYLDTREVIVQAQELMRRQGYTTAALVAHPAHMPRVQAVCTAAGIDWVADDAVRSQVEFDPQSTQKWTRDWDHWRGYEPLALLLYRLKGWA